MTRREKFFKAIRREAEGYVPFEFSLTPLKLEEFMQRTGTSDFEAYYDIPMRIFSGYPVDRSHIFEYYFEGIPDTEIDVFGVGYQKGSTFHFHKHIGAMRNLKTIEEFYGYPYPDPHKDWDWSRMKTEVEAAKAKDLIAVGSVSHWIYEIA